jgi:hypothetical protein
MRRPLSDAARAARRRRQYVSRKARLALEAVAERCAVDDAFAALVRFRLLLLAKAAGI